MTYEYHDEYLEVGDSQEARALKEIEKIGIKDVYHKERLTVLKSYIFCCLENQTQEGDLYEIKLKHYTDEFKTALELALIDKAKSDGKDKFSKFNTPLYRG